MFLDLKDIASENLIEMLRKHTDYYMTLCNEHADPQERKIAQGKIDIILAEIKSRQDFKEVFTDTDSQIPE